MGNEYELETRSCAFPKCKITFRVMKTSAQTGCCMAHDVAGAQFLKYKTGRRRKNHVSYSRKARSIVPYPKG